MKKLSLIVACLCIALTACKKEDPQVEPDGPVIVNPGDIIVTDGTLLDAELQKEKLDQVAQKLMDVFPADEYEDIVEVTEVLYSHCERYFSDEDYDWDELAEAIGEIGESFYDERQHSEYKWEYTYTLFLSNCTGTVTLGKRKATFKESDVTKVIIKDVDGNDWEAIVTPVGLKEVFLGEFMETYYDYYYEEYTDIYNVTVEIPSSLSLQIRKNGSHFASANIKFDYDISKNGLDIEHDKIGTSVEIKVDDVVMTLKNAYFDAQTGNLEFSQHLTKGEYFIYSQTITGKAELDYEEDDEYIYVDGFEGSCNVMVNILGELQLKGSCNDLNDLSSYCSDDYYSEKDCEKAAERASKLLDMGIYYDGTSTRQADIEFDPVVDEGYYGDVYYWIEPVLVFGDGTRYFFYDYFDDRIFEDLANDFDDFICDYEDMVEDIY